MLQALQCTAPLTIGLTLPHNSEGYGSCRRDTCGLYAHRGNEQDNTYNYRCWGSAGNYE